MQNEVNVLALVKGKERYVFLYNDQNRTEIIETFGRYASDPDLSFSWSDAAALTQKALREVRAAELAAARKSFRKRVRKLRGAKSAEDSCFKNPCDDISEFEF